MSRMLFLLSTFLVYLCSGVVAFSGDPTRQSCSGPAVVGVCDKIVSGYTFSHKRGCHRVTEEGCAPGENMYETRSECDFSCIHRPDLCYLPKSKGNCPGKLSGYYFNPNSGRCHKAEFSSCGGNQNAFFTKDDCLRVCEDLRQNVGEDPSQDSDGIVKRWI